MVLRPKGSILHLGYGSSKDLNAMSSNASNRNYPSGKTVPFPYEHPYAQQTDLMDALLSSLATTSKVMLLESPTGTGKSLSLACSAMAWLRHQEEMDLGYKSNQEQTPTTTGESDDWLGDWVPPDERERQHEEKIIRERAHAAREALMRELRVIQLKLVNKDNIRERRGNLVRSAVTAAKLRQRQQRSSKKKKKNQQDVPEDFCVTDYRSDQEDRDGMSDSDQENVAAVENFSVSPLLDGTALDGSSAVHGKAAVGHVQPGSGVRKIVYAARTHSQLTQFVGELRRTAYADVRVVALGGRQVLCGNTSVNRSGRSEQAINDICLDLKKDKTSSCPLLSSTEGIAALALHTLAQPSDIEDAASLGEASHACSYYASRVRYNFRPLGCSS